MQDLTISLVQTNQIWEDKQANLLHFESVLKSCNTHSDIFVFPEMFHTGFTMNAVELAEEMNGMGISWLKEQAKKYHSAIITSLIIKENGNCFNRMVFIAPNGNISYYDKRKLFTLANENDHYTAGNSNTIVTFNGWKILLQVCYDLRFPELCRNQVINNEFDYDLLIYVANWPEKRSSHWKTLLAARAIENQCFVAGVNRVGVDANDLSYSGDSAIINPLGAILAQEAYASKIITQTLSAADLNEVRTRLPFLKDK